MPKPVKVELRGETYSGYATDIHALTLAGFLMPEFDTVIENQKGLYAAFRKFSAEQKELLSSPDNTGEDFIETVANHWAERVIIRIATNLSLRVVFAQMVREIFPLIPETIVKYSRRVDKEGFVQEQVSVCLDTTEVLNLITPVVQTLNDDEDSKPVSTNQPVSAVVEVVPEIDKTDSDDMIQKLELELEQLRKQRTTKGRRSTAK
jgi:hypothetical protein